MWTALFKRLVGRIVTKGDLHVSLPDGTEMQFGDGTGAPIHVTLSDPALLRRFVLNPELAAGEAYMDGTLTIAQDDLHGFLTLAITNMDMGVGHGAERWIGPLMKNLHQFNPVSRARRNVAHHYDLSGELYDIFLDNDRQYSCAYFRHPDMTLEEAQEAKKAHIAKKLCLEPGMRVLDIGCGWGGMALTLAQDFGARVTGVTLSEEQQRLASERVAKVGLTDRVDIRLQDYRALTERFDRIVSVGMFEHVGVPHYREYFSHVHDLLNPDGVALIHTIGRSAPPARTSPWINKYIFPGGYIPSMSEMTRAVEREGLWMTDIEIWRLHYAETLKNWYERFMAQIDKARALYDERFCRMWRFYLVASELTFRHAKQCVFQVQLARRQDAVPLTRDYITA
nr:cyclopropane-fatty-acyl-phospholipid synthase family protein [Salinihabitans flavidus]